jgi:hypothetical protein
MSERDTRSKNRNPRVTVSPAAPLSFTGGPILWAQAEGAGTVTLTDESGTATAFPLYDREAIMGPWQNLVSFTGCTAVRFGDGKVPPGATSAPLASAAAAGTSALSVAPAAAASPIAVGTNDARVDTLDIPIALSGTDGTLAEIVVWRAPYNCTITGAFITSPAAMAANNTDFDTFTLANRPLAGPGTPANIAVTTTKAVDLNALAAYVEKSLATSALTNTAVLAGDMLTFKSVIGGAGKASGPGLLRVTFSVP